MPLIAVQNLRREYRRGVPVLDGVTFAMEQGEVVGLLGRNGAGKTTLLRILMGMIQSQGGEVRLFGMEPRVQPVEIKKRTGFVAEDQVFPPHLRIGDLIEFHQALFPNWDAAMEQELMERFR